jgi:hypothetical protein
MKKTNKKVRVDKTRTKASKKTSINRKKERKIKSKIISGKTPK